AWQREQQHGLFKQWSNAVEFLPEMTPWRLDLLHSVTAESETPHDNPLQDLREKFIAALQYIAAVPRQQALMQILYHKCEFHNGM
ncbi:hypothetical protein ONQ62_27695, partial [Salmonella enterica subsp. enterica serovar Virginia]|nr:hypothetical protein [Salmonella enterica subsp. enterica serovar Virginia]